MLDVIIPVAAEDAELASGAIDSLVEHTDVPARLTVVGDGGMPNDFAGAGNAMRASELPWRFDHHPRMIYFNACVRSAIDSLTSPLTLVMAPSFRIEDDQWFGKMQVVFQKDPLCFVVGGWPNTGSSSLVPYRVSGTQIQSDWPRFAMLATRELRNMGVQTDDPVRFWAVDALRRGGHAWVAPGVRFLEVQHKEHRACPPERSAGTTRSGSRSRTILD